jgi:[protein-PII] uridylyltransferase
MDQAVVKTAPYFNLDALREETSQLARSYSGQDSSLRAALVERLRRLVDDARTEARLQLERDGGLAPRAFPPSRTP